MARKIARFFGVLIAVTAVFCLPPIAQRTHVLGPLQPEASRLLWIFGCLAIVLGLMLPRLTAGKPGRVMLVVPFLLWSWVELGIRVAVRYTSPDTARNLAWLAERTYPDSGAYEAHPFLQFVGRPNAALRGNGFYGKLTPYNKQGFLGKDFEIAKKPGVIRVACLGASTTARGYPAVAERILNEAVKGSGVTFEVYNFAHGFWTSAHTVTNFVLNVVDYQPDYVVVLHGWNDSRALHAHKSVFRGDYSHVFKAFDPPEPPDAWFLRTSVVYRWIADRLSNLPPWAGIASATMKGFWHVDEVDPTQFAPFVRNLRTIAELSLLRGATPVIVTMPHATDPDLPFAVRDGESMSLFAKFTRQLYESELSKYALLVDLDAMITGKRNDIFIDAGHMTTEGIEIKARAVAETILEHHKKR